MTNVNEKDEQIEANEKVRFDRRDLLKSVKALQKEGSVGTEEVQQLRKQLGFTQSDFTKGRQDKDKRKAKNKMAKKARKKNRG